MIWLCGFESHVYGLSSHGIVRLDRRSQSPLLSSSVVSAHPSAESSAIDSYLIGYL